MTSKWGGGRGVLCGGRSQLGELGPPLGPSSEPCSLPSLPELSHLTQQAFWGPGLATPHSPACTKLPPRPLQAPPGPGAGVGVGVAPLLEASSCCASAQRFASSSQAGWARGRCRDSGRGKQGALEPGAEAGGAFLPFPPSPPQPPSRTPVSI